MEKWIEKVRIERERKGGRRTYKQRGWEKEDAKMD